MSNHNSRKKECPIIIIEGRRQYSEIMAEVCPNQQKVLGCTSGFKDSARPHFYPCHTETTEYQRQK